MIPHPLHSATRTASSMSMLDTIIRTLSLTFLDAENPAVVRFKPRTVPAVPFAVGNGPVPSTSTRRCNAFNSTAQPYPVHDCSCMSLSLGYRWPAARAHAPLWLSTPGWDDTWTPGETTKETCRRLCWHSMMLTALFTSHMHASGQVIPEFFVGDPVNVRGLLFLDTLISLRW